jgi:SRSO17 transposase
MGQSKADLALRMIRHAHELEVPFVWLTGDEVYSASPIRSWCERNDIAYVLTLRANGSVGAVTSRGPDRVPASALAKAIPSERWRPLSAGEGAKGPRLYRWGWLPLIGPLDPAWGRWLLVRESLEPPHERAYYLVYAPRQTTMERAVSVAGARWSIEQCFQEAKGEVGLDEYEVRSWRSWHRHMSLSMMAHAFLSWIRLLATQQ